METKANQFFRQIKNKVVGFVGIGVSHTETIRLFAQKGIGIVVIDKRTAKDFSPELMQEFIKLGITLHLGDDNISSYSGQLDIVFRTPGMYYHTPQLTEFRKKGGIVTSEMEVFCDLCPCPYIAITGSDGKTTTTTLISEMLRESGKKVHLGGNIGKALLPLIHTIEPEDYAVVELSSFQLISMRPSPDISVVTNVSPNHLDVHKSMNEYIETKQQVLTHQSAFSRSILGIDNETAALFWPLVRGQLGGFSYDESKHIDFGTKLLGDTLTLFEYGKETPLFDKNDIRLPGEHNVLNYLAACAAVAGLVSPGEMKAVAVNFNGVEHRIELALLRNGVEWYNDSIASSPTRAIAGIQSFPNRGVTLIAGGYDKKIPYEPLAPYIVEHVKTLILLGATGPKIERVVTEHKEYKKNHPVILHASSMEEAVLLADDHTTSGEVVLLSPASASFDMYKNFEVRGKHFKELVLKLPK